ncbi:MAG: DUF3833 family protein [Oleibacter sp.]|nr:DUF3833 family protein [Thalassolituus sp.]
MRKITILGIPSILILGLLSACSGVDVKHAAGRSPELIPQDFFTGKICADGVVRNRSGEEIRSFNAQILASWDDNGVGTLDEIFNFYDEAGAEPKRETRLWTLTPIDTKEGPALKASASDVPNSTVMTYAGNAIYMSYMLRYGEPGDTIDLHMEDWMFQVADGVVVNETKMSKFGFHVGQILLVMRKVSAETSCLVNG